MSRKRKTETVDGVMENMNPEMDAETSDGRGEDEVEEDVEKSS